MSVENRQQIGAKVMFKVSLMSVVVFAVSASSAFVHADSFIIDPVSAIDNGHYPGADASMTINSTILSDGGASVATGQPIPGSYPTITAGPTPASFLSNYAILTLSDLPSGPAVPTIIYQLVANPLTDPGYKLTGGHFWQYSGDREGSGERSLTSADILVSSDGVTYTPAGSLVPGYVEGAYGSTDPGVNFSLTGTFSNVKFVELTNLVAPGDNDIRDAFNEIRFIGVTAPEPGSIVALVGLCGMGLIGLVVRRRRRAAQRPEIA